MPWYTQKTLNVVNIEYMLEKALNERLGRIFPMLCMVVYVSGPQSIAYSNTENITACLTQGIKSKY